MEFKPVYSNVYGEGVHFNWLRKLTDEEFQKIIELVNGRKDLFILPVNTNMGFVVSFQVFKHTYRSFSVKQHSVERVLFFSERSLGENICQTIERTLFDECALLPKNNLLVEKLGHLELIGSSRVYRYNYYTY
jgi:hypothetical protein